VAEHGGVLTDVSAGAVVDGGVVVAAGGSVDVSGHGGEDNVGAVVMAASVDLSPSTDTISGMLSLAAPAAFSGLAVVDTLSLALLEPCVLQDHCLAMLAPRQPRVFDLSKAPDSYMEAVSHPDAPVWKAAMEREEQSLTDMGAFEVCDLPPGHSTIGLKWVYDGC
jgi:hypothetical protein